MRGVMRSLRTTSRQAKAKLVADALDDLGHF
jgi:hypothetical protein